VELWIEALPTIRKIYATPFLQQMKDGTLSWRKFQHHVALNLHYMDRFRHVFALGYQKYLTLKKDNNVEKWLKFLGTALESNDNTVRDFFKVLIPYYLIPIEITKTQLTTTNSHSVVSSYYAAGLEVAVSYQHPLELLATYLPCLWTYRVIGGSCASGDLNYTTVCTLQGAASTRRW